VLSEEAQSKRRRKRAARLNSGASSGQRKELDGETGARAVMAMTQADGAAAAPREAAPGDAQVEVSRGSLGVKSDALRIALWLSVVCAVTAALLAVPSRTAAHFLIDGAWATFGEVDPTYALRDVARMIRREPFTVGSTVGSDWNTTMARCQKLLSNAPVFVPVVFSLPTCYVVFLGASLKVCCLVLGSAILTIALMLVGFVLSGNRVFINYCPALGYALLVVSLKLVCPRDSKVPAQAAKQSLVLIVGNVLTMNVIPETSVRQASFASPRALVYTD
jgi:hypothetical protein